MDVSSTTNTPDRDLSQGVVVVLSGGPIDQTNPSSVLERMEQLILDINTDPYVIANSGGKGLTYKLLPNQKGNHIHQTKWPEICESLRLLKASPLILIGHSNGGAAVVDLARCLEAQGKVVDLAITADSVLTLHDNGDTNKVPANITTNLNSYVIPTIDWWELPFPFGKANRRAGNNSMDGILNIGLPFEKGGAIAHRDAFYDLAGGDKSIDGLYKYPELMLDVCLAALRGSTTQQIFALAEAELQTLANEVRIAIHLESTNYKKTLTPSGLKEKVFAPDATTDALQTEMIDVEKKRLTALSEPASSDAAATAESGS